MRREESLFTEGHTKMKLKAVSGIMLTLLLISMLALALNIQLGKSQPTTWTVDDDELADFHTIQEAVNAASDGDTVFVFSGTYYENVVVNRTLSLVGENRETTVIDGNMSGWSTVDVKASGVVITNFTIRNNFLGVWLSNSPNITVSRNNITNNQVGFVLHFSPNCTISGNYISNNSEYGIHLFHSPNITMSGNVMKDNKYGFGVEGYELSHFMLSIDASNFVDGKPVYYLVNQKNLVINSSTHPEVGYLGLVNCTNMIVEDLTLTNNGQGLLLAYVNKSRITENNITNNEYGIWVSYCSNNSIVENTFVNCGLYILEPYGNEISDNLVNGKPLVYLEGVSDYVIQNAGQVILINCSRIRVENLDLSKATAGVWLWRTNSTKIVGNNITNNLWGFSGFSPVWSISGESLNCTISGNNITNNRFGVWLSSFPHSTLSGNYVSYNEYGVHIADCHNSTISGNNVLNNVLGILVSGESDGSTISGNTVSSKEHADDPTCLGIELGSGNVVVERNMVTDNYCGVRFSSPDNTVRENTISGNVEGIIIAVSPGREHIYHNNFIGNQVQIGHPEWVHSSNVWDNGYPSGGNYWSDYNGTDANHDGIGDSAYFIDANNTDNYPLMGTFYDFNVSWIDSGHNVEIISNSSVSAFDAGFWIEHPENPNTRIIKFNVTGENDTIGFCRICIPVALLNATYTVLLNGTEIPFTLLPCSNSTHSYLYFNYTHSTQEVMIIPEFPSFLILPLFMIATLLAVIVYKRRKHST